MNSNNYPGFPFPAAELVEYIVGIDFVVVSTIKKLIYRHNTNPTAPFCQWLNSHGIKDITPEAGDMIIDIYTKLK